MAVAFFHFSFPMFFNFLSSFSCHKQQHLSFVPLGWFEISLLFGWSFLLFCFFLYSLFPVDESTAFLMQGGSHNQPCTQHPSPWQEKKMGPAAWGSTRGTSPAAQILPGMWELLMAAQKCLTVTYRSVGTKYSGAQTLGQAAQRGG